MKIAHVVDSMEVGGAETLVSQMCRLQREQGHAPSIYSVGALGPLGEQMLAEGFSVEAHVGLGAPESMWNFFRIFKNSRPDVVHCHNPAPTFYAALAARVAGVASIISTRHSLVAAPRNKARELKYAIAATCCDWVVGVCDGTVKNLRQIHTTPARKITRIYNGASPISRVANDLLPRKTGFALVFVGRLSPVKNLGLMLKSFQIAAAVMPALQLWLVGDGSDRKMLEELARKLDIVSQVTFWGQQLDVAPFFSAADAFVMSSISEGLPIALLQAFSAGLPAIVTDIGGMAEAVRLAQAGYVVPGTYPTRMADAILRLATSNAERAQFSRNAAAAYHAHFTLQIVTEAYIEIYRNTLRARRAE